MQCIIVPEYFETAEYRRSALGFGRAAGNSRTHESYPELLSYLAGQPEGKIFMVYAADSGEPGASLRALFLYPKSAFAETRQAGI